MADNTKKVVDRDGKLIGYERLDEDGNLIEFIPVEVEPTDTCCGCGGCFAGKQ